ncbi:biofilm-associated metzincin protease inhibitor BamI [Pseudomonas tohonis]|uniref:hypothetical protein n=1 Tax=Pseudomonas tohonis TaxID=2725477 RepID=UPI0021D8CC5C|nr:hypothetical protein [Pseudomonas tohonis]UXY50386.1 hypothetical protein N9L84_15490 [Pseudomonas tohonis]
MRKIWLYPAVALVTAGTTLAVLLKDAPAQGDAPPVASSPTAAGSIARPALPGAGDRAQASVPATGKAAPALPTSDHGEATLALWAPDALQAEEQDGMTVYHTRTSPDLLGAFAVGTTLQLGVPGRQEPLRAKLEQTHNTGSTAVWSGAVEGGSDAGTLTVVKGRLETHITLATPEQTLSFVVDNATGATQVTDQNALLMRATPDPIVTPDAKQLPPLPPPAQG